MATVRAPPQANPLEDVQILHKAMKGFGSDEKAIISVIAHRMWWQRQAIVQGYTASYGDDLYKKLRSELTGNLESAVVTFLMQPAERDAELLRKALQDGIMTDDQVLIEIICSRYPNELQSVVYAYKTKYNRDLVADVRSTTRGDFERVLVACLQSQRPMGPEVDMNRAQYDADALYKAGVGRIGTSEGEFIRIFCTQSSAQMAAMADVYARKYGHDIEKVISKELSGDLKRAFKAIIRSLRNRPYYFAKCLRKAMKGMGTNDRALIRTLTTRAEFDLAHVAQMFQAKYKKPLAQSVRSETSGYYRDFLMAIMGE
ncbi:annexin [Klebsormidium nitens]|uniref:Annexin n=1 Tax=Klebsormidium nitens TaxID=105231 RepID=A0A0U9HJP6_KLENI|nr:annexin [Klebsormidium nitens]|eukprot:GAQ83035.1 annexin [Klebsormidium nitens]